MRRRGKGGGGKKRENKLGLCSLYQQDPSKYTRYAQLLVSGLSSPITLSLHGQGNGPKVTLSTETLYVGELLYKAKYSYEFDLENRGEIDANFRLVVPTTDTGKQFRFSPASGVVPVG